MYITDYHFRQVSFTYHQMSWGLLKFSCFEKATKFETIFHCFHITLKVTLLSMWIDCFKFCGLFIIYDILIQFHVYLLIKICPNFNVFFYFQNLLRWWRQSDLRYLIQLCLMISSAFLLCFVMSSVYLMIHLRSPFKLFRKLTVPIRHEWLAVLIPCWQFNSLFNKHPRKNPTLPHPPILVY